MGDVQREARVKLGEQHPFYSEAGAGGVPPFLLPLHHLKYSPAYSGAAYVDCSVYAH